jgi:hypothetical protein
MRFLAGQAVLIRQDAAALGLEVRGGPDLDQVELVVTARVQLRSPQEHGGSALAAASLTGASWSSCSPPAGNLHTHKPAIARHGRHPD